MNNDILLTPHFVRNWKRRVGSAPAVSMVLAIIRNGIRVHEGRELRDLVNQRYVMLAVYWQPDLDLVINIDTTVRPWRAVSVLSRENLPKPPKGRPKKRRRRQWDKPRGRRPRA